MSPGSVFPLEVGLLSRGLLGSMLVALRIAERDYPARAVRVAAPWAAVCVLLWVAALWLLAQPMEMRRHLPGQLTVARAICLILLLALARPLAAHTGPPFPILEDETVGPYTAQVWTDPDIGIGRFGRIGLVIYGLPFLMVAGLWCKVVLRRRQLRVAGPETSPAPGTSPSPPPRLPSGPPTIVGVRRPRLDDPAHGEYARVVGGQALRAPRPMSPSTSK